MNNQKDKYNLKSLIFTLLLLLENTNIHAIYEKPKTKKCIKVIANFDKRIFNPNLLECSGNFSFYTQNGKSFSVKSDNNNIFNNTNLSCKTNNFNLTINTNGIINGFTSKTMLDQICLTMCVHSLKSDNPSIDQKASTLLNICEQ